MSDITHSADLHTLTASTPPGATRSVQPFGIATAPVTEMPDTFAPLSDVAQSVVAGLAARRIHPDAEVIDLARRVKALNVREQRLWGRTADIESAVDEAAPLTPADVLPEPGSSFSEALSAHDQHVAEVGWRLGLPRWEKMAIRASRRMARWGLRLAHLAPQTQAGLKAKAEAATVCTDGEIWSLDGWRKDLATSISADALRIIGAEADARAEGDRPADGELLALGRAWEANCGRYDRACAAEEALIDALDLIAIPEALFVREGEDRFVPAYPHPHVRTGRWWYGDDISICSLRNSASWGCPSPRRDEIIAAHDRWRADIVAEDERSALRAARAEREAAVVEGAAIRARICLMKAHTQAGIDLKVRVVLSLYDNLESLADALDAPNVDNPEFSDAIALSIVLDLARRQQEKARWVDPAQIASAA